MRLYSAGSSVNGYLTAKPAAKTGTLRFSYIVMCQGIWELKNLEFGSFSAWRFPLG